MVRNFFALLILICPGFSAAQYEIQLFDQDGKPVSKAVISVVSETVVNASAKIAIMDQIDRQFVPHVLVIQQGQFVTFPNSDNIRHHVYSFSDPKPFEIKLYRGTPTTPELFDKAGVVILGCNIHDHMVGYIYVAGNEKTALTNESGIVVFSGDKPDTVKVWHSRLSKSSADEGISIPLEKKNDDGVWQITTKLHPEIFKKPKKFRARFK